MVPGVHKVAGIDLSHRRLILFCLSLVTFSIILDCSGDITLLI